MPKAYVKTVIVGLLIWRDERLRELPCLVENLDARHVSIQAGSIGVHLGGLIEAFDEVVDFGLGGKGHDVSTS